MSLVATKVAIRKNTNTTNDKAPKAFATVTLNEACEVDGFTIWNENRVSVPQRANKTKTQYFDSFRFNNEIDKANVLEAVKAEYRKLM